MKTAAAESLQRFRKEHLIVTEVTAVECLQKESVVLLDVTDLLYRIETLLEN
jgi:hypothetical protein